MLDELNIKNAALIKRAEIKFNKGLNVISGETGAGKSMVIGSLMFALGERASKDFIREGEDKTVVEAVFTDISKNAKECAEGMGIDCSDDELILQRTISREGRTSGRINGTPVTASMLKELSARLLDIHSQHESQSLLNPAKHIDILDRFCGKDIEELKTELTLLISDYKSVLMQLKAISGNDEERQRRLELIDYKINDIESAGLKEGEEEALLSRKKVLASSERLIKQCRQCLELLYYGNGDSASAVDKIGDALKICNTMSASDSNLSGIFEEIDSAHESLQNAAVSLKDYLESISADPNEINTIEERLDLIYSLKKKYGSTVEEILKRKEEAVKERDFILNSGELRHKLNLRKEKITGEIKDICGKITLLRKETSAVLQERITSQLHDLEMKSAQFEIDITQKGTFNNKGWDNVEFLISTNAGEGLKPLAKTASGGEMSRVMLGLKTVISGTENIGTFVFDEIDTGISGKTASKVAEKMAYISDKQQIVCITHLPQIASMADGNMLIEKSVENGATITTVKNIENKEKIYEILRLMGSNESSAAVKAAEEMIEYSSKKKTELRGK